MLQVRNYKYWNPGNVSKISVKSCSKATRKPAKSKLRGNYFFNVYTCFLFLFYGEEVLN